MDDERAYLNGSLEAYHESLAVQKICEYCGENIMDDDFITDSYCCEEQHEKQVGWQP